MTQRQLHENFHPSRSWPRPLDFGQKRALRSRYYMDSEFVDDGSTIDLISIGIVAEDGRELYLQSVDFNPNKVNPWVRDNVVPHLSLCTTEFNYPINDILESKMSHYLYRVHNGGACALGNCPWRSRKEIRDEVQAFLDPAQYGKPELYTWCGTYDHIAFCQLWGKMVDLPQGFPHHVYDLQCELSDQGISDEELPPQEGGLHNALADARHIRHLWGVTCGHYVDKLDAPILPPYVS